MITEEHIKEAESRYLHTQVDEDKLAEYVCGRTESAAERGEISVELPVVTVRLLLHCFMVSRHNAKPQTEKKPL